MIRKLYLDTWYYIRFNYVYIIKIIIIITSVQVGLDHFFLLKKSELIFINNDSNISINDLFNQLSENQRYTLIKIFIISNIFKIFINTTLCISILTMLQLTTNNANYNFNSSNLIKKSVLFFPKLLLLIFYNTLFIQLGLLLALIPGVIVAILTSLSPIVIINDNTAIIKAIQNSVKISIVHIHLIAPAILLWFLIKIIIAIIWIQCVGQWIFFIKTLLNGIDYLVSIILLIYLYHLYINIKKLE